MPGEDNEKPMTSRERRIGDYLLKSLRQEVSRFVDSSSTTPPSGQINVPYYHWFRSYLLIPVFGWPDDRIRVGRGFDIILLDQSGREVVTVETKGTFEKATKDKKRAYRQRLTRRPRLVAAYFTNSLQWDRLDLDAPAGKQEVRGQASFDASQATAEETAIFFRPLIADWYLPSRRSLIAQSEPYMLELLGREQPWGAYDPEVLLGYYLGLEDYYPQD